MNTLHLAKLLSDEVQHKTEQQTINMLSMLECHAKMPLVAPKAQHTASLLRHLWEGVSRDATNVSRDSAEQCLYVVELYDQHLDGMKDLLDDYKQSLWNFEQHHLN